MMLALTSVARSQPDGYTLGIATLGPLATNPVLYKRIDYDPRQGFFADRALREVAVRAGGQSGAAGALGPRPDQARQGERQPSQLFDAGRRPDAASLGRVHETALRLRCHAVPYRNTPQSVTDIVAGHVASALPRRAPAVPLIKEGKLRAIAVSSKTRLPILPEVPPFGESVRRERLRGGVLARAACTRGNARAGGRPAAMAR